MSEFVAFLLLVKTKIVVYYINMENFRVFLYKNPLKDITNAIGLLTFYIINRSYKYQYLILLKGSVCFEGQNL